MNTIQIKTWHTQEVIFEYKAENATLKDAVEEAVRQGINLSFADLIYSNLNEADLKNANLRYAFLRDSDLNNANLEGADLKGAYLLFADLRGANLEGADLSEATLAFADLNGANLKGVNSENALLFGANGVPYDDDLMPLACPAEGSFVAWKKVDKKLVKLEIPEDAKRSSATSKKCRCSKAKVLAITNLDETESFDVVLNVSYAPYITYKVGEMVYPDTFDENRWNECSHGIHFFMDKNDALNW